MLHVISLLVPDEHRWTRAMFTPQGLGLAPERDGLSANMIIDLDMLVAGIPADTGLKRPEQE